MPDDQRPAPETTRGREASRPQDIPRAGWMDVAKRAWGEVTDKNLFLAAGGVTYAVLLALFPGLAALVSVYGLVLDPHQVQQQINQLSGVLPSQTQSMISTELNHLVSSSSGALGFGLIAGLLVAIWSASRGMSGMITALTLAYGERETRSFIRFNLLALELTAGAIIGGLIVIALVAGLPAVVQAVGFGGFLNWLMLIVEWPLLMVVMMAGLAVLYRYAPNRDDPQWRWVSPGAIVATVLWLLGSIAFSVYVSNFGSYNATYGSLGGAVVLMTWLYLSAFVVLLGAAVNAQSERQTRRDTTQGTPQPMGTRGAYAADTVGEGPGE